MKNWMAAVLFPLLGGCADGVGPTTASALGDIPQGPTEYLVLNGRMNFEQCRASGGLIIRDPGNAMVACDPTVKAPKQLETSEL